MPIDENLQSYARAYLLRAQPDADRTQVDAYVASAKFKSLVGSFDKMIEKSMTSFMDAGEDAAQPPTSSLSKEHLSESVHLKPMQPMPLKQLRPALPPPKKPAPSAAPVPPVPPASPAAPEPPAPAGIAERPVPAPAQAPASARAPGPAPGHAPASAPVPEPAPPVPVAPDLPDISFRLPAARAGEPYAQQLEAVAAPEGGVVFGQMTPPAGLDLQFDSATGIVSGTPEPVGEHALTISYHFASQPAARMRTATVTLAVNPDPRKMWRNQESNRCDVYWKPDEDCSRVLGEELAIIAASKRGRSHAHLGSFRDDDFRIARLDTGWYVAAVSDGAGSAKFSRKGAALICEEALKTLQTALAPGHSGVIDQAAQAYAEARAQLPQQAQGGPEWQTLRNALYTAVGNAAYYATKAIVDECAHRKDELQAVFKDYSSTALLAICKRYPFGTLCAAYWVGDGAVGVYSSDDGIRLLGEVDSGEFSGQTRFLDANAVTQESLLKRTRFELVDHMTALVVMTDGVSDPKFETEARLARPADWHELWNDLDRSVGLSERGEGKEQKLLAWLDFWSQGNHDDRTIAIIY